MKKIMLILAITGIFISCSSKDESVKKETVSEVAVVEITEEVTIVEETTKEIVEETTETILTVEDYEAVSEPVKKSTKKFMKQNKVISKPIEVEEKIVVEEKTAPVEVVMDVSVDDVIDKDVNKQIAKTETETKVVEVKAPKEESSSNKTLFGVLGAILVAAAAIFVFKKK